MESPGPTPRGGRRWHPSKFPEAKTGLRESRPAGMHSAAVCFTFIPLLLIYYALNADSSSCLPSRPQSCEKPYTWACYANLEERRLNTGKSYPVAYCSEHKQARTFPFCKDCRPALRRRGVLAHECELTFALPVQVRPRRNGPVSLTEASASASVGGQPGRRKKEKPQTLVSHECQLIFAVPVRTRPIKSLGEARERVSGQLEGKEGKKEKPQTLSPDGWGEKRRERRPSATFILNQCAEEGRVSEEIVGSADCWKKKLERYPRQTKLLAVHVGRAVSSTIVGSASWWCWKEKSTHCLLQCKEPRVVTRPSEKPQVTEKVNRAAFWLENTDPAGERNRPTAGALGTGGCPMSGKNGVESDLEELVSSIDRSRKRHLDEGLLRGDLVLDRLATQEASASPVFKRTRTAPGAHTPPDKMAMTMAEFKEYMDSNTNKRIGDLDKKVGGMQTSIARLDASVKANSTKLDKHDDQIAKMERELQKVRNENFPALPSASGVLAPPLEALLGADPPIDVEYALARRSLRLWPILGSTKDELWHSVGIFLGNNLGLEGKLDRSSIESIKRVELPSGPGVTHEALVCFKDVELRDVVMGTASKLAPYLNAEGRATAGMRMEVPPRLRQSFRVLFKYGQNLRARHGPGTRRHVKFNDMDRNLFLNVKLPGDEQWSRVSMEVALRGVRARETINDSQLERRLDITGGDAPRQRAASTSGPPPLTQASAWTRRSGGSSSS